MPDFGDESGEGFMRAGKELTERGFGVAEKELENLLGYLRGELGQDNDGKGRAKDGGPVPPDGYEERDAGEVRDAPRAQSSRAGRQAQTEAKAATAVASEDAGRRTGAGGEVFEIDFEGRPETPLVACAALKRCGIAYESSSTGSRTRVFCRDRERFANAVESGAYETAVKNIVAEINAKGWDSVLDPPDVRTRKTSTLTGEQARKARAGQAQAKGKSIQEEFAARKPAKDVADKIKEDQARAKADAAAHSPQKKAPAKAPGRGSRG